jgi:hypothetical protein
MFALLAAETEGWSVQDLLVWALQQGFQSMEDELEAIDGGKVLRSVLRGKERESERGKREGLGEFCLKYRFFSM